MSALGHYLEQEGIATVSISLIREHTAALNPPRALWVPFMLGRPLGVPNDAAFQTRVLRAALGLLERDAGPVLEEFAEDAPYEDLGDVPAALNCPVSFPRMRTDGSVSERLADEIAQLQAWHEVAVQHNGRTTLGVTGLSAWLPDNPQAPFRAGLAPAGALKLAADELKTFYYEAKAVQPGRRAPADVLRWFWLDTAAGATFVALRDMAARSADPGMKGMANLSLVPRAALPLLTARGEA